MKFHFFSLAAAIALLSSCASSYTREFTAASAELPRPPANAEGTWTGTWKSNVNGHTGPLWCIVQPAKLSPSEYDFRYRAGWGMLKFGDYTHTTPAKLRPDGSMKLSGKMTLPGGFGTYRVNGLLTRDAFNATYHSKGDHGTMILHRPATVAGN